MENKLTATESLEIIQSIIRQRKQKFEDNGNTILAWGVLVCISGIAQYIMVIKNVEYHYLVWACTMIPAFIITMVVKSKESKQLKAEQKLPDYSGLLWATAGIMAFLTGFAFGEKFGIGFTAMMYAPFCIAAMSTALQLRNGLFALMSILSIIVCYTSLYIPFEFHPLIASAIAMLLMIIPGLKLASDYKKRTHV